MYNSVCGGNTDFVQRIYVDEFDYMMIVCRNSKLLRLYHINGTFLNIMHNCASTGFTTVVYDANFDTKGRLVLTGYGSIGNAVMIVV